nr:unnamed protein product [Callosobruchus chinensis]
MFLYEDWSKMPEQRASWTEATLTQALEAISNGMASKQYGISRRTLRNHILTGSRKKRFGHGSLLSEIEERQLCQIIFHLAEIGMPLTS